MNKGFIKLSREILEWEWYQDANSSRLMIHLLLKANFSTKKWQGKVIKPGELITSLDKLSKETGLTVNSIRYALKKLKTTGYIFTKSTSKFTHIKVCKSEFYTDAENLNNKQIQNTVIIDTQLNHNPVTTTNKVNNEKELLEKKEIFKNEIFQFKNHFSFEHLISFYNYWSEECKQTGRMKFEDQKHWNLQTRLESWKSFSKEKTKNNFNKNR